MRLVVDANILFSFFKYLAVALSLDCAIWSKDRDLKEKQFRVVIVTTEELTKLLGSSSA